MTVMSAKQLQLLGATHGAYSVVTEREATGDRSVTLDGDEKLVLSQKVPLNSIVRRGGVTDNRPDRKDVFFLNLSSLSMSPVIDVSIVYPKAEGNEIRLYMQGNKGFFGNTGDVFVIFCRANDAYPTVGFISPADWSDFWSKLNYVSEVMSVISTQDADDSSYQQNLLLSQSGMPVQQIRTAYPRSSDLAKQAIENSGFTCEVEPHHQTFLSPVTGRNFMEAHHLIPMSHQALFRFNLDDLANIFSLCPCCHRAVHFGDSNLRKALLDVLFRKRGAILQQNGVNFQMLCSLYGIND
ncbi:HNH endonuclease [Aeromonas enteropelogenes]|uniref:HNH endonuclease n=1 Tax=Aeromonas enteropelogenes TaxID=29489 RepID=UPI003BA2B49A